MFIYEPSKSIEVNKKTEEYFSKNEEIKERIISLGFAYQKLSEIIPQTYDNFWSGHFFPFSESWNELQVSFTLVCFGLYKQAFVSLRSGLELGLLSVYYNINDEGHKVVQDWVNSRDTPDGYTPRAGKVWKILLANDNIKEFNGKHNLKQLFDSFHYLHNYVHSQGFKYSNEMGLFKSNFQTFEPTLLKEWLKSFSDIVALVSTLHLLKYPLAVIKFDYRKKFGIEVPNFGGLTGNDFEIISRILPKDYIIDIEKIAEKDKSTQNVLAQIKALPNLTEEQKESQLLNMEKRWIKAGAGFNNWLEDRKKYLAKFGITEFSDKMKKRIEILRAWATKNNLLEPQSIEERRRKRIAKK